MGEEEETNFKFVKIKKHVLKVHIHCQGCEKKVRKLVGKIEGVYKVKIECDLQKVIVWGKVECTTLINKLVKSGKHAELWRDPSPTYNWVNDDDDEWESYMSNRHHHIEMDEGEDDIRTDFYDYYNLLPHFNTRQREFIPHHDALPLYNTQGGNIVNSFPNYYAFPQRDDVTMNSPNYNALPQFNTPQSSYIGFPVCDYHNHPSMNIYNMHAPHYNTYPYSIMY